MWGATGPVFYILDWLSENSLNNLYKVGKTACVVNPFVGYYLSFEKSLLKVWFCLSWIDVLY